KASSFVYIENKELIVPMFWAFGLTSKFTQNALFYSISEIDDTGFSYTDRDNCSDDYSKCSTQSGTSGYSIFGTGYNIGFSQIAIIKNGYLATLNGKFILMNKNRKILKEVPYSALLPKSV